MMDAFMLTSQSSYIWIFDNNQNHVSMYERIDLKHVYVLLFYSTIIYVDPPPGPNFMFCKIYVNSKSKPPFQTSKFERETTPYMMFSVTNFNCLAQY